MIEPHLDRAALVAEAGRRISRGSRSFALASRILPRAMREDAILLYAWCRHCDDVVDGQDSGGESVAVAVAEVERRLHAIEAETAAALQSDAPVSLPFQSLRLVARRHDFPDAWPTDLLRGFAQDVAGARFTTFDDLLCYCYRVAGVVGVMMARIMGVRDPAVLDRACDLGLAFQLTNIARDVSEDARAGRIYLCLLYTSPSPRD